MGTREGRVGCCVWLALCAESNWLNCILPRELRWVQEWFMRLMSRGNNVKRCDTSCQTAIKMPSSSSLLLLLLLLFLLHIGLHNEEHIIYTEGTALVMLDGLLIQVYIIPLNQENLSSIRGSWSFYIYTCEYAVAISFTGNTEYI